MILAPVAGELKGRRLVFVPDGDLRHVPFGALPDPGSGDALLARHEIVLLASVSELLQLRRKRAAPVRREGLVAVFADPVFGAGDPRCAGCPPTTRSDVGELRRLGQTRQEARWIGELVAERKERGWSAQGFDANRTAAMSPRLGRYGILHFATHADRSGLLLSTVDAQGRPRKAWLRASDIERLDLPVELVVLSACRTGSGGNEGTGGLAQAFRKAGARRVVASLWEVSDEATAELMKRFYEAMLRQRLPPASALRQAQLSLRRDPAWSSPYYWAGFTLYGDWH